MALNPLNYLPKSQQQRLEQRAKPTFVSIEIEITFSIFHDQNTNKMSVVRWGELNWVELRWVCAEAAGDQWCRSVFIFALFYQAAIEYWHAQSQRKAFTSWYINVNTYSFPDILMYNICICHCHCHVHRWSYLFILSILAVTDVRLLYRCTEPVIAGYQNTLTKIFYYFYFWNWIHLAMNGNFY